MNLEKEVFDIALTDILPNRFQPREKFDEQELNELALSIKEHGVIQPIIVRKIGDKYEIVAGERRFRASSVAGKTTIPALIRNIDDKESAKIALLENLQRKNLTPIEEARTYQTILKLDNLTQEELANNLGKSQSAVANKLRLLNLIPEAQDALLHEKISERHARSLLNLTDQTKQKEMLDKIILNRMTVKQLDDEISLATGTPIVGTPVIDEEPISNNNFVNNFVSSEIAGAINEEPVKTLEANKQYEEIIEKPVLEEINKIEEPVFEVPIEEKPISTNQPANKNIFDGLRRDNTTGPALTNFNSNPEPIKVEESKIIEDAVMLEEQPKKDPFTIEETYIPTPEEIINAPKEEEVPIPRYDGPKYDLPNINIEQPSTNEQSFSSYDKIEALLDEKPKVVDTPAISSIPELKVEPLVETFQPATNDIYDMRFAINNFRQAVQNTEKFGFNIETEEFDFDNVYQIVIKIDKNKKTMNE